MLGNRFYLVWLQLNQLIGVQEGLSLGEFVGSSRIDDQKALRKSMRAERLGVSKPFELLVCLQVVFVRQDTPGTLLRIPFDNKVLGDNLATSQHFKPVEA